MHRIVEKDLMKLKYCKSSNENLTTDKQGWIILTW